MAISLKTVEYWFETANCTDAVDTNLPQITIYLPESSITFKNVILDIVAHERNTSPGNITRRQCSLQLGSAGYSSVNNASSMNNTGENVTFQFSGSFTSYFTSNWSGTSMTCDVRVLLDTSTAVPLDPAFVNISAVLYITYEYDDTSSTHIKTVRIPLDCPVTAMGTSKPGSANATIPALDTELPETNKSYKQKVLVLQGCSHGSTTDLTFSMQVDTDTQFDSYSYEHGSGTDMFVRMNSSQSFTTDATHGFYVWCSAAYGDHMQAWLVVTYEFDSSSNTIFNSVMLPFHINGQIGNGGTSSDYIKGSAELYIEEPSTITTKQLAAYVFLQDGGPTTPIYAKIGSGSYVTYTDGGGGTKACSNTLMIRNDSAYTLSRGKNTFYISIYSTYAANAEDINGYIIVNYTSSTPSGGVSKANKTIIKAIKEFGTTNSSNTVFHNITSTYSISIPETNYFISSSGGFINAIGGAIMSSAMSILFEKLEAESGRSLIYSGSHSSDSGDSEISIKYKYYNTNHIFKSHPNDVDTDKINIETDRKAYIEVTNNNNFYALYLICTYHANTFAVAGTISGSNSGTVNLDLFDGTTDKHLLSSSRSGDGAYSLTWYDSASPVYVVAYEDDTHLGRSANGYAS